MSITPQGYVYGRDPKQTNPFWESGKPGETTKYVEFLTTSQIESVKDNIKCTNYIINYLNHEESEEILNIYVPFFDEYYTKSEIDNKNYLVQSDLNNYYTKSQIDDKNFLTNTDLDNYYTKSEIDNKNYALKSDLNNYYTKTQIDDKNFLTNTDLDNYYTKSEIDNKNYALKSDLNNYYTKTQIDDKLNINYYTKSQISSNYYNKTDTTALINSICEQKINESIGGIINGQY